MRSEWVVYLPEFAALELFQQCLPMCPSVPPLMCRSTDAQAPPPGCWTLGSRGSTCTLMNSPWLLRDWKKKYFTRQSKTQKWFRKRWTVSPNSAYLKYEPDNLWGAVRGGSASLASHWVNANNKLPEGKKKILHLTFVKACFLCDYHMLWLKLFNLHSTHSFSEAIMNAASSSLSVMLLHHKHWPNG